MRMLREPGLVALGGSVGTAARFGLDSVIRDVAGLPIGTFVINVSGAFGLGLLIGLLVADGPETGRRRDTRLLLGTGLLGGYTTYSLVAADIATFLIDRRIVDAAAYGLATVVVGGLAGWAGLATARAFGGRS